VIHRIDAILKTIADAASGEETISGPSSEAQVGLSPQLKTAAVTVSKLREAAIRRKAILHTIPDDCTALIAI
jgi:hypothetical protein